MKPKKWESPHSSTKMTALSKVLTRPFVTAIAALGIFLGQGNVSYGSFMIDPDPEGMKFYNGNANKSVSGFTGTVGGQHSGSEVVVTANGKITSGAGFSNIKPVKEGTLTQLVFTPVDGNAFSEFSFRGQLLKMAQGILTLTVQGSFGNSPQTFVFKGLGANKDFERIGITSLDGETIRSVTLSSYFKEEKQNEFGRPVAVPEPATYIAGALLLIPFGAGIVRSLKRKGGRSSV